MKNFIPYDYPTLTRETLNGSRVYATPDGRKYPSVTTVTGFSTRKSIEAWRKRVGEEEANKISSRAARRGTDVHQLCEDYLRTGSADPGLADIEMFMGLRPFLDRIDNIWALEQPLFSHHLKVAGTVDCIAEFDGKLSIIDFKTSRKPKKEGWISNYFMQTSAYAVMFEEMTGKPVNRLVIIIGVDDHDPQLFFNKRDNWINKFIEVRQKFEMEQECAV